MDTTSLQPLIRRFLDPVSGAPVDQEHDEEYRRRAETARQLLQPERIPHLTREEIAEFLQNTNAWNGVRGKQQFWRRLFGTQNERLPALCETLADLVRRAELGLTAADFNSLLTARSGIGPAYLSEILTLRFPERYWLWNKQVRDFLAAQQVDLKAELPRGKKGDAGEEYLAAGRHIADVRRALSAAAGRPVDYLLTDIFVYWVNQQDRLPDPWAERIARWLREDLPPERIQARLEGEARARALLEAKLGQLDEADLRQFLADLSADWYGGKTRADRFMPALYGAQINRMLETLPLLNRWIERLWQADDAALDALLNEFWDKLDVAGAGTSLPTALLYLRAPEDHSIWLPVMSEGLKLATGFVPGRWRTAEGYRHYNTMLNAFRARYQVPPQSLDVILWKVARTEKGYLVRDADPLVVYGGFSGFAEDTFRFLQELAANNSEEWMHRDGDANELRYRQVLREPLRELFKTVGPAVKALDPAFETEAKFGKVLAVIKKRWPDDEGPYHTHYWGAFYRQGRTKQTDAQLFVIFHPTHVNVGFSVAGAQGSDVLTRFRRNLQQALQVFLGLLQALPPNVKVRTAERHGMQEKTTLTVQTLDDLQQLLEPTLIDIERRYPADDPILLQPEFAAEVESLFRALYPIYRFAVTDDPDELADLLPTGEEEAEEPEPEPRLTLSDLSTATFLPPAFLEDVATLLRDKKQLVFYGPPGTGKTFVARQFARYWVDAAPDAGGAVQVVQFHPSYAYEEFVEGIRPQSVEGTDGRCELSYPVKKGLFRRLCDEARGHPNRYYVLILDEINRGELPRILGELLYLLEYRDQTVTLPYSGEPFAIPPNLYLIGTMNTADRSIALVDHALRRRFHFVALKPNPEIVRAYFESNSQPAMAWTADLLERVNRKLEQDGVEWHRHIGHSHFMCRDLDEVRLRLIWAHSVLPTLEEYFYRQPDVVRAYALDALKEELGLA